MIASRRMTLSGSVEPCERHPCHRRSSGESTVPLAVTSGATLVRVGCFIMFAMLGAGVISQLIFAEKRSRAGFASTTLP